MTVFTANADYEEKDTDPLKLRAGDEVTAGPADRVWPGWIWASNAAGCDGYVPREILRPSGGDRYEVTEAFDPAVLTIRRGDRLDHGHPGQRRPDRHRRHGHCRRGRLGRDRPDRLRRRW